MLVVDDEQLHDRVAELEERVRLLEDRLAIQQLISSWGPAVDTGNSDAAASLFTHDCVLESDLSYLIGPASIAAMVLGEGHQALIRDGSAHIPTTAIVNVDEDRRHRDRLHPRLPAHPRWLRGVAGLGEQLGVPAHGRRLEGGPPDGPDHRRQRQGQRAAQPRVRRVTTPRTEHARSPANARTRGVQTSIRRAHTRFSSHDRGDGVRVFAGVDAQRCERWCFRRESQRHPGDRWWWGAGGAGVHVLRSGCRRLRAVRGLPLGHGERV